MKGLDVTARQASVRGVLIMTLVFGTAAQASAQGHDYFGLVTPHLGVTAGGDAQDAALTPGVSIAVFENGGWGAEADVAYARGFDSMRFPESSLSSFMLNAIWSAPRGRVRPFGEGGLGLVRSNTCTGPCAESVTNVDVGFNLGGGLMVPVGEFFFVRGDIRYFRSLQEHPEVSLAEEGALHFWRTSVGFSIWWPVW